MGSATLALGQAVTMLMVISSFAFFGASVISVMISTSLVCFGFAFSNPTLTSAASKRAKLGQIGGSLGLVQGFGSLGQVGGLMIAGPCINMAAAPDLGVGALISMALVASVFGIMTRQNAPST